MLFLFAGHYCLCNEHKNLATVLLMKIDKIAIDKYFLATRYSKSKIINNYTSINIINNFQNRYKKQHLAQKIIQLQIIKH